MVGRQVDVTARVLLGKSAAGSAAECRLRIAVRCAIQGHHRCDLPHQDDESTVQMHWEALRIAFLRPRSGACVARTCWADDAVLVFHLTNHYCPVHALREWIGSDGAHVRQLLTARSSCTAPRVS